MSPLITTILITTVLFFTAFIFLGISWFLTGKSRFRVGMCGKIPQQKKDRKKGCGETNFCPLCNGQKEEKEEDDDTSVS